MLRRVFCKLLLVAIVIFSLLALSSAVMAQGHSAEAFEHVRDVQERNIDRFMAMEGVEGTAIGYNQNDQLAVKVFTAGPGVRGIPQEIDGVKVQVVVTGKIYALTTGRYERPVPIGVSTGHPDITAGTIGCRVTDGPNVYALSNNHVYANSNEATIGDNVLQPGAYDGGTEGPDPDKIDGDEIGTLAAFEPIVFGPRGTNTIDAAIALTSTDMLGTATPDGEYGTPSSTTFEFDEYEEILDLSVQKYGRTTGLTQGEVTSVNGAFRVHYSSGFAIFVEQIVIEGIEGAEFSAGGDSGSLIVVDDSGADDDLKAVGLLFAGGGGQTIANPIDLVLGAFGVTVDSEEATLPATGSISGMVTASDGTGAIVGATVSVDTGQSATTASDGMYTITDVPTGDRDVTASADGFESQTKTANVTKDLTTTVDFVLDPVAEPTTGSITGTVINTDDGTAISGATVSVDTDQSATTADDGTYTISDVPTGERSVTASADGFELQTTTAAVTDGVTTTVDFALNPVTTVGNVFVRLPSGTDGYATEGGRDGKKHLLITVALEDNLGGLVAGASVSIDLILDESFYTSGTGTTGTYGTVTFKVANAPSGTYTTVVTDVTAAGLTWDELTPDNGYNKP